MKINAKENFIKPKFGAEPVAAPNIPDKEVNAFISPCTAYISKSPNIINPPIK